MHAPWSLPLILTGRRVRTGVLGMLLMLSACTDEGTPPSDGPLLSLRAVDASCTEVWLEVRLAPGVSPRTITLQRDSLTLLTTTLRSTDTLIVDDGLLPNRRYTYTLSRPGGLGTGPAIASALTMDTTSHEFTWQVDTLGATASMLNDVVIINDTLAYAVGEIYLRDSAGVLDPRRFNLARWNGATWRVERVPYTHQGQNFYHPIQTVIAFGPDDVWFAGNGVVRWDGRQYLPVPVPPEAWGPYRVNRMWGESATDLYIVGDGGSIAHFDGSTWRRIESGTTLSVYDVFGSRNPLSGETEVLAVASNVFQNQGARILRIQDGRVTELPGAGLTWGVNALWFAAGRKYYVVGPGIHWKRGMGDPTWSVYPSGVVTRFFSGDVRGQSVNDVFVVGSFGEVVHFNGITWRRYFSDVPLPSGALGAVALRNNLVMASGMLNGSRGIVLIGRR